MSVGFYPKNNLAMDQANKVQELSISGSDSTVFQISGGNLYVRVLEPISKIYLASVKVDSSNLVTQFDQASLSIVDSTALTAGGDSGAIKITGLAALASGDCLIVKYQVQD